MDLARKLQLRPGQSVALVNLPQGTTLDLGEFSVVDDASEADAVIVYCSNQAELEQLSDRFVWHAASDRLTWVAYPKAGQLATDLNRDSVSELVKARDLQPVRQVAMDNVWSALRLRPC